MTDTGKPFNQVSGEGWELYNGDCVEVLNTLPASSIDYSIFSPPYGSLYIYSGSVNDLGNCASDDQFFQHFGFVIQNLYRVMKPGRIVSIDCMNIPAMKERDGYIGLKDFRGAIIRHFVAAGFIFHSEHCIWKDPLIEATRTKSIGLLHKQLMKDSTMSRAGIPQYLISFRMPGINLAPVNHPRGLDLFCGEDPPLEGNLSHERWRRYASPVWMDIRMTRTLNATSAREQKDERHLCPMSLDIIERGLTLYSNPRDLVLDPFAGIGSSGVEAIKTSREFIGIELKKSYFDQCVANLRIAYNEKATLFNTHFREAEIEAGEEFARDNPE
jgi:DNA modification methylase